MTRIEAGATPPLNPRNLLSSSAALPSRAHQTFIKPLLDRYYRPERQLPQKLADLSQELLRPHTDYAAFLATTRLELSGTTFSIPSDRPFQDAAARNIVGIGSNNTIKERELRDKLQAHRPVVERVGEAEEEHTLDVEKDATSKAIDAAKHISEGKTLRRRVIRTREFVTMSTDVLNAVPVITTDKETGGQKIEYQRLGKPNNLKHADGRPFTEEEQIDSVRQTFQGMAKLSAQLGDQPLSYLTEMATVIHDPKSKKNAVSIQRSAIFLSPEGLSYLASPEGFADYQKRLSDRDFTLIRIAGGLELDILDEMGFVTYITGTASDIQNMQFTPQREAAKTHAYSIALGHADERLIDAYFQQGEKSSEEVKR